MTQIREGGVEIPAITQGRNAANCSFYPACYIMGDCPYEGWQTGRCGLPRTPTPSPEIAEQPMGEDAVVERQNAELARENDKIHGSDLASRKLRLSRYLRGFSGAYGYTHCTPAGDLDALLATPKPADPTSIAGERDDAVRTRLERFAEGNGPTLSPYQDHNGFAQHDRMRADLRMLLLGDSSRFNLSEIDAVISEMIEESVRPDDEDGWLPAIDKGMVDVWQSRLQVATGHTQGFPSRTTPKPADPTSVEGERVEDALQVCATHLINVLEADPGPKLNAAYKAAREWWHKYDADLATNAPDAAKREGL